MSNKRKKERQRLQQDSERLARMTKGLRRILGLPPPPEHPSTAPIKSLAKVQKGAMKGAMKDKAPDRQTDPKEPGDAS